MSSILKPRDLALGALLALTTVGSASANGFYGRDVYMTPTEYVLPLETSWYAPTMSVLPSYYATSYVSSSYVTSSYLPTSYSATSYVVAPTVYRETYGFASRRPWFGFGRRRSFYSTAYYLTVATYPSTVATVYAAPTSFYETAYEPTASACCDPRPACCETGEATAPVYQSSPSDVPPDLPPAEEVQHSKSAVPPKSIQSSPTQKSTARPTTAAPSKQAPVAAPASDASKGIKPSEVDADLASPPESPAPEYDPSKPTTLSPADEPAAPVAPSGELPLDVDPKDDTVYQRDARKPVLTASRTSAYVRSANNGTLHILEGIVFSSVTNETESGVTVTISNKRQTFADRVVSTGADGRYKVRLPDGDWTVSVTAKSGKVYPVSDLVVSEGQITDETGDPIPSLTITR